MNLLQRIRPAKPQVIENLENLPIWKRIYERVWCVAPNTTPKYKHELNCIQQALTDVMILEKVQYDSKSFHELARVTDSLKNQIQQRLDLPSQSKLISPSPIFKLIDEVLTEEMKKYPLGNELSIEPAQENTSNGFPDSPILNNEAERTAVKVNYRLHFARNYFQSLDKLLRSNEISHDLSQMKGVNGNLFPFHSFVECLLIGNSSERIQRKLQSF